MDTGYILPLYTGEDYNQWNDAADGLTEDELSAYPNVNGDQQDYYGYAFALPSGSNILGIEADLVINSFTPPTPISVGLELSGDGGTTYTTTSYSGSTTSVSSVILGGPTDLWGKTWTSASLAPSNFRIRVTALVGNDVIDVDVVKIKVYYVPFTMQINIGGSWKTVSDAQINIGGTWKTVESIQNNIGGSWKTVL